MRSLDKYRTVVAVSLLLILSSACPGCGEGPTNAPRQESAPAGEGRPSEDHVASTLAPAAATPSSAPAPPPATATELLPGDPARVLIPRIGVDAPLARVGLKDNGEMVVPESGAGWYEIGPKPGGEGPAVLVAHRSWNKRPGVFHRLNELRAGDVVRVEYKGGRSVVFAIESSEVTLKSELPVARIWNETTRPVLRLITCGGDFDRKAGRYRSNIILYGSLVTAE